MAGRNVLNLTSTQHHLISPATDPSTVRLPEKSVVCVLGASRGIGASIAHAYAKAGANKIILTARSVASLKTVAAECSSLNSAVSTRCEPCDVASNADVEKLAAGIKEREGRLDVVIYNSGYYGAYVPRVTDGDPSEWERCLSVNTLGTYHAAHHLLPILLHTEGARAFVVVSTAAAWVTSGPVANPAYCISKLAQLRLVEMMAVQYKSEGLLTVGVHPGAVPTDMTDNAPEEFRPRKSPLSNTGTAIRKFANERIDLIDSVDLCGGVCVWLTKDAKEKMWLTGRFVSATWDVEELVQMKQEILDKDLLKVTAAIM